MVKKTLCFALLCLMGSNLIAGNEMYFKKVEIRTSFGAAEQGNNGNLVVDSDEIRFVDNKGREYFSIPSDSVNDLFYSRVSGRRIGAAILITPLLLFSKGKKHYLTIGFDDSRDMVGAVEFKLHKSNYRGILRAVEAVSDVTVEFEQEGIKDEKENIAERKAAENDGKAKIEFISDPEGADIEIEGAYAGATPRTKSLDPGEYQIKIELKGYKKWEKKIIVEEGEEFSVRATLEKD